MRGVALASMRTHARRYLAAVVAVVIGVAFVVIANALASATRNGSLEGLSTPYDDADVVVSAVDAEGAAALLDLARERGADAATIGWTGLPVSRDGRQIDDRVAVGPLAVSESLRWQVLRAGRFPDRAGDTVVDRNAAKAMGVRLGDRLRLGSGAAAVDVTVVGLVDSPSSQVWAHFYVTQADHARLGARFHVDSVVWHGPGSTGDIRRIVHSVAPHARVRTVDDHVQAVQKEISLNVDVVLWMTLLFAGIALFVSVMVIANTFTIVFAQRSRDFALLRCVGATRVQVLRSIRLEALALGAGGAVVGLGVGTGLGLGVVALVREASPASRMGQPELSPAWYAGAFLVGVLATVVATWLPTRRAVRVSPLAALAPAGAVDVRSAAARARVRGGLGLVGAGAALLAVAVAEGAEVPMFAGGAATFVGVLMLGPVVVPRLMRVLGAPLTRLGATGRIATGNSVRDPRRTAATTSSLLVGVTLTTAVLTGLASARASVTDEMDRKHPIDVVLTAVDEPLPVDLLGQVRAVPGVADARAVAGVRAVLAGHGGVTLVAPRAADTAAVSAGPADFADVRPGELLLPLDLAADLPDGPATVTVSGVRRSLEVRRGEGWGEAAVVAPETLRLLIEEPTTAAVWVRADRSADPEDLVGDLSALVSPVDGGVENGLARHTYADRQLDIFTGAVLALLGVSVLVALIGIASTLGLSVLERAREHALLRALGLTRRRLRATLALEAVLCTAVAAVEGTLLGVVFAWVGVATVVRQIVDSTPLVLPVGQLVLVLVGTGVAGLVAAVLPARRASRVAPAAGLAVD
jgi:putative ABC transport system permease protein